jgi:perosamine synthetase
MIPISKPSIGIAEQEAVARVLESGMLAQGPRVAEFERAFAEFIGVKHAIATANGTTALHAALLAHHLGPGDEVITTPFTFIASVNAILYTGACPVFVDVDETFNLDPAGIEPVITSRTKAIMPVHLYGQPADLDAIGELCRRYNLILIEDACQAHGATFRGKRVGSFGTGCFSFYATKNMTTGEGGMITTNDDQVAETARLIIAHGMRVRYYHEQIGYNYRMTDIAAAIGLEQLKKLAAANARRAETAQFYNTHLASLPNVMVPTLAPHRTHVWHQYTIRIMPEFPLSRDQVVEKLREVGIGTGIYYPVPVHQQKAMQHVVPPEITFPRAEMFARQVLSLPVHPSVSDEQRAYIVQTLEKLSRGETAHR